MSRIDELLARLCPQGVRFARLGDISRTIPGLSGKSKADFSNGNARFVTYKQVYADPVVDPSAAALVRVHPEERQHRLHLGDVIFTGSSEGAADVGMSSVVASEPGGHLYLNSFCFAVRFHDERALLPGFSKHLFRSEPIRAQIRRSASGVTRINISKQRFASIVIPLPPLEIQREIVQVLDKFTQLEAELEAELEARRVQHGRVRAKTLVPGLGVASMPLSALVNYVRGVTYRKSDERPDGQVQVLRSNNITLESNALNFADVKRVAATVRVRSDQRLVRGDILISAASGSVAHVGKVAYSHSDTDYVFGGFMAVVRVKELLDSRYLFHLLADEAFSYYLQENLTSTTINNLSSTLLGAYRVPVPSLEEQRSIADTLDRFDLLVNDMSSGLPAELAARRKQYEHYRDRLLTFQELAA